MMLGTLNLDDPKLLPRGDEKIRALDRHATGSVGAVVPTSPPSTRSIPAPAQLQMLIG